MVKLFGALALASVVSVSGCAKSDWIDRTLVTVDVTGTWCHLGTEAICLELEQTGATVKGLARYKGGSTYPVEGSVSGDVLRLRHTNGQTRGELTVSGDEMVGELLSPAAASLTTSSARNIVRRRVDPSTIQDLAR